MCGIVGTVASHNYELARPLQQALELMQHRGPDGSGSCFFDTNKTTVALGHNRLSIIDLSDKGQQPFHSPDGQYSIIFNGEIYNFEALKQRLPNTTFVSDSDTEVLLHLYIQYGTSILNELKGMFAFALLDRSKNQLLLVRDPLGIKPLYYHQSPQQLVFASEIKALFPFPGVEKTIDPIFIHEFLSNGFLYEPDTGFKNIKKLPAGHFAVIDLASETIAIEPSRYWHVFDALDQPLELNTAIQQSIQHHLVSDAPLGLFFSGGIDSSIILNQLDKTAMPLVARYDQDAIQQAGHKDDYHFSSQIAQLLDRKIETIDFSSTEVKANDFLAQIEMVAQGIEELTSDFTFIASRQLSAAARQRNYKVMLSGMGADELFAGYPRYLLVKYAKWFRWLLPLASLKNLIPKLRNSKKIDRFISFFRADSFALSYASIVGVFSKDEIATLHPNGSEQLAKKMNQLLRPVQQASDLKKAMYLDLSGFLAHNFAVADKSSMLESIELRVPLATPDLAKIGFALSDNHLIAGKNAKAPLKKHLARILPKALVYRKKTGFNPPLDNLILQLGKVKLSDYLSKSPLYNHLNRSAVEQIIDTHFAGKGNETYKLYNLLFLAAWLKTND